VTGITCETGPGGRKGAREKPKVSGFRGILRSRFRKGKTTGREREKRNKSKGKKNGRRKQFS